MKTLKKSDYKLNEEISLSIWVPKKDISNIQSIAQKYNVKMLKTGSPEQQQSEKPPFKFIGDENSLKNFRSDVNSNLNNIAIGNKISKDIGNQKIIIENLTKIKTINEFYLDQDDIEADEIVIPKSVIESWIKNLTDENEEVVIVQVLQVQEEMQKFLDDYYDNQIEPSDPDDVNRKRSEVEEPIEELSTDDENPNFIKKFEDS